MNGHFETDQTAYPIGYLNCGNGYKVTDMRYLHALHSQPISLSQAKGIASQANLKLQGGQLNLRDGDTGLADFVTAEVATL